jgi:hypothetical protein
MEWTRRAGGEIGMWEAIDDFQDEIIAGMEVEDLPPMEKEVLRDTGT